MQRNTNVYEFKYSGENQAIDAQSVLISQLHFISLISEIKNQVAPDAKLNIKLQGLEKGSLEIHQLVELAIPASLFFVDKYSAIKNIFNVLGDILKIKKFLGDKKADNVINSGDHSVNLIINMNSTETSINVGSLAWRLYTENQKINDSLSKTGKTLEESDDINDLSIRKVKDADPIVNLNRDDFHKIKRDNPYSGGVVNYEVENNQIVGIKKTNLLPEPGRVLRWDVLYRGNNVSLKISDQDFISQIMKGFRFGNGDKLLVDIKKTMRLDTTFNMFVETGHYEAIVVHKVIPREDQAKFDL